MTDDYKEELTKWGWAPVLTGIDIEIAAALGRSGEETEESAEAA